MKITFYHTADVHFGVENYGKIDAKTGIHSRLLDFNKALGQCIDKAVEEKVDIFFLAGDAYKTAYPTPTQQKMLCGQLLKLYDANIPTIITIGNHDHPLSFGKANALDIFDYLPLNNFFVFSRPELLTIQTKNGPVQVVGIPWPTRNALISHEQHRFKSHHEVTTYLSEKVGQIIQNLAEQLDPKLPAILTGHLTVTSGVFSGSEKRAIFGTDPVFLPSQLAVEPFDYVALGHLHRHQNLNKKGKIPVVYSGSIERVDFGERKEEKGYCTGSISVNKTGEKKTEYSFIPIKTRPMIQIEVKIEHGKNQTEQLLSAIKKHPIKNAIVKILYHVPADLTDKVDLLAIQRACRESQYLVGIIPKHNIAKRDRRIAIKVDMDLPTMLDKYFDEKPELKERKKVLIKKALELGESIEEQYH